MQLQLNRRENSAVPKMHVTLCSELRRITLEIVVLNEEVGIYVITVLGNLEERFEILLFPGSSRRFNVHKS